MGELVDPYALGAYFFGSPGSSPGAGTKEVV